MRVKRTQLWTSLTALNGCPRGDSLRASGFTPKTSSTAAASGIRAARPHMASRDSSVILGLQPDQIRPPGADAAVWSSDPPVSKQHLHIKCVENIITKEKWKCAPHLLHPTLHIMPSLHDGSGLVFLNDSLCKNYIDQCYCLAHG